MTLPHLGTSLGVGAAAVGGGGERGFLDAWDRGGAGWG
ncbi:MAG: hypothetical protein AVDCRST_MAG49-2017 [uncultured Thermomicrobiales bacterium]|uniref:Uncharacterized protein n=1 Tax=uncultured Thermomicrobiales bacterium TaxID=1645740 RepID=A0A6J4UNM6_9BACT|nr:MAG: hypothetical protein AVDCRST_MAG49-2017 [uncultured Thermomicrobiales bacterium]